MIKGLIEDTLFSTQPAMVLNLKASASSPLVRKSVFVTFAGISQTKGIIIKPILLPGPHGPSISGIELCTPECTGEATPPPAAQGDLK